MLHRAWAWAKEHPGLAAALVVVGVILILWLLGFFSRSAPADNSAIPNAYLNAANVANTNATSLHVAQEQAKVALQAQLSSERLGVAAITAKQTSDLAQVGALEHLGDLSYNARIADNATALGIAHVGADTHVNDNMTAAALADIGMRRDLGLANISASRDTTLNTQNVYKDITLAQIGSAVASFTASLSSHNHDVDSTYNYQTQHETIMANADATQRRIDAGTTALLIAAHPQGGVYGTWNPSQGQITVANSGIGGPVDPAVLAQVAQYPWLRGAA